MLRLGFLEIWMVPGFNDGGTKLDCSPRPAFTRFGKKARESSPRVVPCGREEFGTMLFTGQIRLASNSFLVPMANHATTFRLCLRVDFRYASLHPNGWSLFLEYLVWFFSLVSTPFRLCQCLLHPYLCRFVSPASSVQKRSERNGRERTGGSSTPMIDEYELQR